MITLDYTFTPFKEPDVSDKLAEIEGITVEQVKTDLISVKHYKLHIEVDNEASQQEVLNTAMEISRLIQIFQQ